MAGCVMLDELRRVGVELFADEPEVVARIKRLCTEILTDEVGHVGYCAARCGPPERAMMRWLYPRFGRLFARQTAEISLLTDPEELHARLARPFDVEELVAGRCRLSLAESSGGRRTVSGPRARRGSTTSSPRPTPLDPRCNAQIPAFNLGTTLGPHAMRAGERPVRL